MKIALVLPLLLLAACGGEASEAAAPTPAPVTSAPATSAAPAAGPGAFVAFAKTAQYGTKALSTASDDQLLAVGNSICDGLPQLTYGQVVRELTKANGGPSVAEAETMARQAVVNLCPQYTSQLPG